MITFWNRKEVYVGYSMSRCSEIRSILAMHHIKYTYKTINGHNSSALPGVGRKTIRSIGVPNEFRYMYYIYVHKNDYDLAYQVINKRENFDEIVKQ